jgi:hypothetical protein
MQLFSTILDAFSRILAAAFQPLAFIWAGRKSVEASIAKKANEVKDEQIKAANERPADRDAVSQRLRDGEF